MLTLGFLSNRPTVVLLLVFCGTYSLIGLRNCSAQQSELTAEMVLKSVNRGVTFLKGRQQKDGRWKKYGNYPGGSTALCSLALLNCGVSADDPAIVSAIDQLLALPEVGLTTYVVSLRIMTLAAADPKGKKYKLDISKDVRWLLERQVRKQPYMGGWGYGRNATQRADSSNTQFAMLALHEASRLEIDIPQDHWRAATAYWIRGFNDVDGGFAYDVVRKQSTGSMTCAGISSLIIALENMADAEKYLRNGQVSCCMPSPEMELVEAGIEWMANHFRVTGNPAGRGGGKWTSHFYYLYGMERAGRLSGRRFFRDRDWYREGANLLVRIQERAGSWQGGGHGEQDRNVATSLALLFLAKGKRPIALGKFKFGTGNNWNHHPKGVHFLTRELEKQWAQKLNWQTIRSEKADFSVKDLLETPVLFISGKSQLDLVASHKKELKKYIEAGNFIFAEACQGDGCGKDVKFDQQFRDLMAELFPDSQLDALQPDHPIWNAHFQMTPDPKTPILGLQACCRTSVVYCPKSLSCRWQLLQPNLLKRLPQGALTDVEYATRIGVNVVSYATGRQLRDKLDLPSVLTEDSKVLVNRVLKIPKLVHGGGSDDAPNALRNILIEAQDHGIRVDLEKLRVAPSLKELAGHPFLFMHGRNSFQFDEKQRKSLKAHLNAGGFIFVDSICRTRSFAQSVRKEFNEMFPETPLEPIPADHAMWTKSGFGGFDVRSVTLTKPDRESQGGFLKTRTAPLMEGIKINGEYAVIFSPFDVSCAMENATFSQCEGYTREDAAKLVVNILLYKLNHD